MLFTHSLVVMYQSRYVFASDTDIPMLQYEGSFCGNEGAAITGQMEAMELFYREQRRSKWFTLTLICFRIGPVL